MNDRDKIQSPKPKNSAKKKIVGLLPGRLMTSAFAKFLYFMDQHIVNAILLMPNCSKQMLKKYLPISPMNGKLIYINERLPQSMPA